MDGIVENENRKRLSRWHSIVYMKEAEKVDGFDSFHEVESATLPPTDSGILHQPDSYKTRFQSSLLSPLKVFPILYQIKSYTYSQFLEDFRSAVTIAFVLIPQAMGYSQLANVDPIKALLSAVFPLLGYAIFGASRQLSVGPEALSSVLVGVACVNEVSLNGGATNNIATALGFYVGVFCVALSLLGAGFIDNIISGYLLNGFIVGVAFLIIVEQLPGLLGVVSTAEGSDPTYIKLINIPFTKANLNTVILSCSCLVFLFGIQILKKKVGGKHKWIVHLPAILTLVFVTIVFSYSLNFSSYGIKIIGDFNNKIPTPSVPLLDYGQFKRLLPNVIVISIVGYIESQSVTRSFGLQHGYFPSGDRELFALGTANILGSFFGSYVTFGSLPRSRILATAGARTTIAGILSALIVLTLFSTLETVLRYIPKAVLCSIVANAGFNLIEFHEIAFLVRMRSIGDSFMFLLSFSVTTFISISDGIVLCLLLSALLILRKTTKTDIGLVGRLDLENGDSMYIDARNYPECHFVEGVLALTIYGPLEFYNAGRLRRRIELLLEAERSAIETAASKLHDATGNDIAVQVGLRESSLFVKSRCSLSKNPMKIIFDLSKCDEIDTYAALVLSKIFKTFIRQKCTVIVSGASVLVRHQLEKGGAIDIVGKEHYVPNLKEAFALAADGSLNLIV
ncbi:Solute carrier 26 [Boothiomyces sp. JEL0838]|nr:Solute carrier 26 [Boothiomyces sp. JEL0838]